MFIIKIPNNTEKHKDKSLRNQILSGDPLFLTSLGWVLDCFIKIGFILHN